MSKKKIFEVLGTALDVTYKAAVVVHEVDMATRHLSCGCYRSCRCYRRRPVFAPVVVVERPYNVFDDIFAPRQTTVVVERREDDFWGPGGFWGNRRDGRRSRYEADRAEDARLDAERARDAARREADRAVEARAEARVEVRKTERKLEDLEAEVARLRRKLGIE